MLTDSEIFLKDRYVISRGAITKKEAELIAQYAIFQYLQESLDAQGDPSLITYKDIQVPNAFSKYADPLMESLLIKLLPHVEKTIGLSLYPTYSYYRVYGPGDELKKHIDRPACEISITINLGYFYNTEDKDYRWNIWINDNEIITEPGDMVIYRGTEIEHWREPFNAPEGSWQAQAFLHYVDVNGPYTLCKYDGRPMIGYPLSTKNKSVDSLALSIKQKQ